MINCIQTLLSTSTCATTTRTPPRPTRSPRAALGRALHVDPLFSSRPEPFCHLFVTETPPNSSHKKVLTLSRKVGTRVMPYTKPAAHVRHEPRQPDRVVQVDPIKPTLKAPGTNLLTLKYVESVSTFAFNFNLRRYNQMATAYVIARGGDVVGRA